MCFLFSCGSNVVIMPPIPIARAANRTVTSLLYNVDHKSRLTALRKRIIKELNTEDWLHSNNTLGLSVEELDSIDGSIISSFANFVAPVETTNKKGQTCICGRPEHSDDYYDRNRIYMFRDNLGAKDKLVRKNNLCKLFILWLIESVVPKAYKIVGGTLQPEPNDFSPNVKKKIVKQMIKDKKLLDFFQDELVAKAHRLNAKNKHPVDIWPEIAGGTLLPVYIDPSKTTALKKGSDKDRVLSPELYRYIESISSGKVNDSNEQLKQDYASIKTRVDDMRTKVIAELSEVMEKVIDVCFDEELKTMDEKSLHSKFVDPREKWGTIQSHLNKTVAPMMVSNVKRMFNLYEPVYFRTKQGIQQGSIRAVPGTPRPPPDTTTVRKGHYDVQALSGTIYKDIAAELLNPEGVTKHVNKYPIGHIVWFYPYGPPTTPLDCVGDPEKGSNMDRDILRHCHKGKILEYVSTDKVRIMDYHHDVKIDQVTQRKSYIPGETIVTHESIRYHRAPLKKKEDASEAKGDRWAGIGTRQSLPTVYTANVTGTGYTDTQPEGEPSAHAQGGACRHTGAFRTKRHLSSTPSSARQTAKRKHTTNVVQRKVLTKRCSPGASANVYTRKPHAK